MDVFWLFIWNFWWSPICLSRKILWLFANLMRGTWAFVSDWPLGFLNRLYNWELIILIKVCWFHLDTPPPLARHIHWKIFSLIPINQSLIICIWVRTYVQGDALLVSLRGLYGVSQMLCTYLNSTISYDSSKENSYIRTSMYSHQKVKQEKPSQMNVNKIRTTPKIRTRKLHFRCKLQLDATITTNARINNTDHH